MPIIFANCIELIESKEGPAVTGMKTCKFTYDWTIKNFGGWNGDTFESPIFSSHYADFNDNWSLKFYPRDIYGAACFCKFGEKIILDQYVSLNDLECTVDRHTMNHGTYSSRRNVIRIRCTITMSQKGIKCPSADEISKFNAKQQLSQDLEKLLLSEKSSDVTIQVGQKSFRAIKAVLEVRSPVFAAIFDKASPIDQTAPYVVAKFFDCTVTPRLQAQL
ncbi:protein roadkill-like [Aphidius gifuensis]|uniref:protein roadkill-like n=1 Tax=Aphidius gifuensis TaxID=684658 RepID=UPI001CDD769F|nr:protein roadkill-like [Aphidius gifuensis]